MATSPEASLNPARRDDRRAVLCALEFVAGGDVELIEVGRTEVGQGMPLEPGPQEFDWVQVRRVRRQERRLDGAIGGVQILAHELTSLLRWAFRPSQMISSGRFKWARSALR